MIRLRLVLDTKTCFINMNLFRYFVFKFNVQKYHRNKYWKQVCMINWLQLTPFVVVAQKFWPPFDRFSVTFVMVDIWLGLIWLTAIYPTEAGVTTTIDSYRPKLGRCYHLSLLVTCRFLDCLYIKSFQVSLEIHHLQLNPGVSAPISFIQNSFLLVQLYSYKY